MTQQNDQLRTALERLMERVKGLSLSPRDVANALRKLADILAASPETATPLHAVEAALIEWEHDTGKNASASEQNAFIDGFNARAAYPTPAATPQPRTWISVKERLPEFPGTYIVAVDGPGDDGDNFTGALAADWSPMHKLWCELRGWGQNEVTHWMPLPPAPFPTDCTVPSEDCGAGPNWPLFSKERDRLPDYERENFTADVISQIDDAEFANVIEHNRAIYAENYPISGQVSPTPGENSEHVPEVITADQERGISPELPHHKWKTIRNKAEVTDRTEELAKQEKCPKCLSPYRGHLNSDCYEESDPWHSTASPVAPTCICSDGWGLNLSCPIHSSLAKKEEPR